jgi:phosphoenolpyruvate synthase/pyruvate phosphate dikinase
VVNKNGIFGEIINGRHHQLTQGFHSEGKIIQFGYLFSAREWKLSMNDVEAKAEIQRITNYLHVPRKETQKKVVEKMRGEFSHDYLMGYFETVTNEDVGLWFIDYNHTLGKLYENYSLQPEFISPTQVVTNGVLRGQCGSPGTYKGVARILLENQRENFSIQAGEILICRMTRPEHLPWMQKSGAIVTDEGGVLTHAAIVARELKKPCLVGTGNATQTFRNGDSLELNAQEGWVRKT